MTRYKIIGYIQYNYIIYVSQTLAEYNTDNTSKKIKSYPQDNINLTFKIV